MSRRLVVFCLAAAALASATAAAGPAPGATEIEGRKATLLLRRAIPSFRVFAFRGESAEPIPFQVDERDLRERWAIDQGPGRFNDDSVGVFDANDALVFMNRDLGARGSVARLPLGASAWAEVRVGPEKSPLGYAYVGTFRNPPPPATADYCRYDPKAERIDAERYSVTFGAPLPTELLFAERLGGRGPNVLAGVRARGEARFFRGLFKLARSEKDLEATLEGWRDGAVRVIRTSKYWIVLPLGFKARARVHLVFYRDFAQGIGKVKVSIPPRLVPAEGELSAWFDFIDQSGARLLAAGELSEAVNGQMTPAKRRFNGRPARWAALLLPSGETFVLGVRPEGSLQKLTQQVLFRDGAARPGFGFRLSGVERLETGEHDLIVSAMLLESADSDEVIAAANLLVTPPEVSVAPPEP